MNKQELIAAMRDEIFVGGWCEKDFEKYDVSSIEKCGEPFLWTVRETGTSLDFIGATRMRECFANEQLRMEIFRDETAPIASSLFHWCDDMRHYYFDGLSLVPVSTGEIKDIYQNLWSEEIKLQRELHKEECEACKKELSLVIMCDADWYNMVIKKSVEMNDPSLGMCLSRLTHWDRQAVNHTIEIYKDFGTYDIYFVEMVNGQKRTCGGIVYDKEGYDGKHWSMHT